MKFVASLIAFPMSLYIATNVNRKKLNPFRCTDCALITARHDKLNTMLLKFAQKGRKITK